MNPKIMTCPPLPEHLEIGQRYKRPCIRTNWQNMGPLWLPVIGSIHSDPEHVQADFPHVHVDYRFLTPETREELLKQMAEQHLIFKIHPVHATPISSIWPEHLDAPIQLTDEGLDTIPENTWMAIQPHAYMGPYPEYPEHIVHWLRQLSAAYANHTLVDALCPHQGTDLSGIDPDQHGVITCPLHGLKWSARTGRIIMPPEQLTRGANNQV